MKNYKIKTSDVFIAMPFYHVEGGGSYMGKNTIIDKIVKLKDSEIKFMFYKEDGFIIVKSDAYVYPVGEWEDVTLFDRLLWKLRNYYFLLKRYFL